ncbi:unnamed protein product [Fraxinus pennsylvanica]|uniref:Terpene synthase N-terminal domain-containing protein n=1 Tax=Fraxinus pennsylvanica TaxID=56036 RepID=A0AAD2E4X0_9LAMI|nr:unnamed protein product [Fraxinus pennsylvanica]
MEANPVTEMILAFTLKAVLIEPISNTSTFKTKCVNGYIAYIREKLDTLGEGRTSISPYDTAWIALVKNLDGLDLPQFPSSVEWIANNQLSDGSWGDEHFFLAYDRLLNTLAYVVALRPWNVHARKIDKEEIYSSRDQKMKRIPKDLMHKLPTSLLFSLEGFQDLDWKKLLKLQTPLGSFLTSPSSTAFALMETKEDNCFRYLDDIVHKFNGGADLFARLWAIDRLQRLGISRFFESQINDFLNYVYSARYLRFCDIDDTSMAFRLLRLHGFSVNPGRVSFSTPTIRTGLELPWYADLPRIEARFYIEQYGSETDVWIGKTLYRMPDISNNVYLNLAKLDYNICQAQHETEWNELQG